MKLQHAILGGLGAAFVLLDAYVLFASHRTMSQESAAYMAFFGIPAQLALLTGWAVFGFTNAASRLVYLVLGTLFLSLVLFRAHVRVFAESEFESALFSYLVIGPHLALNTLGFCVGRFYFRLRLLRGNELMDNSIGLRFRLRELLAWTAGAAIVAFVARYVLAGCVWIAVPVNSGDVYLPVLIMGGVSLLVSPTAMYILWLEEPVELRLVAAISYFVAACVVETVVAMLIAGTFIDVCSCGGGLAFINGLQLLPIAFAFWLIRMSGYRLEQAERCPNPGRGR